MMLTNHPLTEFLTFRKGARWQNTHRAQPKATAEMSADHTHPKSAKCNAVFHTQAKFNMDIWID